MSISRCNDELALAEQVIILVEQIWQALWVGDSYDVLVYWVVLGYVI